jgi:YHS domain-containing protein
MKAKLILAALTVLLTLSVSAQKAKRLVNVDENGTGLRGYDPVAYFTENKPVKGDPKFSSVYNGARYWFASAGNKAAFDAEPAKYEPQFGGFCAYGMSRGYTAPIKPEAFMIVDGRLLLQYNLEVRDKFNEDTRGNLRRADENWPKVVEKEGK